jgi:hypothetical protein
VNHTLELVLLILAFILGALDVFRSRGQSLAGWGVVVLAIYLILKFGGVL